MTFAATGTSTHTHFSPSALPSLPLFVFSQTTSLHLHLHLHRHRCRLLCRRRRRRVVVSSLSTASCVGQRLTFYGRPLRPAPKPPPKLARLDFHFVRLSFRNFNLSTSTQRSANSPAAASSSRPALDAVSLPAQRPLSSCSRLLLAVLHPRARLTANLGVWHWPPVSSLLLTALHRTASFTGHLSLRLLLGCWRV